MTALVMGDSRPEPRERGTHPARSLISLPALRHLHPSRAGSGCGDAKVGLLPIQVVCRQWAAGEQPSAFKTPDDRHTVPFEVRGPTLR